MRELQLRRKGDVSRRRTAGGLAWRVAASWVGGAVVAIAVTTGLTHLLRGEWPWHLTPAAQPPAPLDLLKVGLSVVAGMGGVVALVVAYRRQQHLERDDAGAREEEKAFRDRYAAAATQLGNAEAAVRLAGVYAMANLADDWEDQRQQCVDVLCAYLRLPWSEESTQNSPSTTTLEYSDQDDAQPQKTTYLYPSLVGEREIRRTLIRVIARHLYQSSSTNWSDLDFDFRGAHLPHAEFAETVFRGKVDFEGAKFSGDFATFKGATFRGEWTTFAGTMFSSTITNFNSAKFNGKRTTFSKATFGSRQTGFDEAMFGGKWISFYQATFSGEEISFLRAIFNGEEITFTEASFGSERTTFAGATFSGEQTSFYKATFSGIRVSLYQVTFSSERTSFSGAMFDSERTTFAAATFSGEQTDFDKATFSGKQTSFEEATFNGERTTFTGATFSGKRTEIFAQAVMPDQDQLLGLARFEVTNLEDPAQAVN